MIDDIRCELFKRLRPRYEKGKPLTFAQKRFVEEYMPEYGKLKDKRS
jgi:hypothetical protein